METHSWESCDINALITHFFEQDDLKQLVAETGSLLACPLLVLDDAFHVAAHFCPLGFSDRVFKKAVSSGEITYEAGAIISKTPALSAGKAGYIQLEESVFRRRFSPLISAGVRLGYLICIDVDDHLQKIPAQIWQKIEMVLAKQLFVEASRQDKPFETTEEILMHLLNGGFSSAPYFRLQTANTYLADFHPLAFALIDQTASHPSYLGDHLKEEIAAQFPNSHSFFYQGNIFFFLEKEWNLATVSTLAKEFECKIILSEPIRDLFDLPKLYRTAYDALEIMVETNLLCSNVCTVAQLRTPLMLKSLGSRNDLIAPELRTLAEHDQKKGTQYCETLYFYLICGRSLKKTCNALFTHRNTILYRIRRMQEDFMISLDDPKEYMALLMGTALLLFNCKGPKFFLQASPEIKIK